MTDDDLSRLAALGDQCIEHWTAKALTLLEGTADDSGERHGGRVDDAAAHAIRALTRAVRQAPDGRPTAAAVRQSRSYRAAVRRLDEVQGELLNILQDAREACYREVFPRLAELLDPSYHRAPNVQPAETDVRRLRAAWLHGVSLNHWLLQFVNNVRDNLMRVLTLAGGQDQTFEQSTDAIEGWAVRTKDVLRGQVAKLISDGWTLAEAQAGRDIVHEQFLELHPLVR